MKTTNDDFAAKYGWVKDADIIDCPTCRAEGRGGWPVSPAVGYCRRCGWEPGTEGCARPGLSSFPARAMGVCAPSVPSPEDARA